MVSGKNQFESFDTRVGDIESYLERLAMHFLANDIVDNEGNVTKRKAILLSLTGADTYRILKEQSVLTEKTYAALASELKKHFKPKWLAVVEQFCFNTVQQQQQGQTIAEFVAQLKNYQLIVNTHEISLKKVYEIDLFVDYTWKI